MRQKRLLGIVRFFDPIKGFGFIDTNGYGIDPPSSQSISEHIELFFSYRDIGYCSVMAGQWVSFVYRKNEGHKRDRAKSIKDIDFSEDDFILALHYKEPYSSILSPVRRNKMTVKNVVDTFTDVLYNTWRDRMDYTSVTYLSNVIRRLDENGRDALRDVLSSLYKTEIDQSNLDRGTIDYLLESIPEDCFDLLFKPGCGHLFPELRILAYHRQRDPAWLLDESMIIWWNALSDYYSGPFYPLINRGVSVPKEIGNYIAESEKSSDSLLLWGFIMTKVPECFFRIKDRSVCYSSSRLSDTYFLERFLRLAEVIPEDVMETALRTAGLDRVSLVYNSYIKDGCAKLFPPQFTIQIVAIITIQSEKETCERHERGGHFTWGEGWDPHYVWETYLVRQCNSRLYVNDSSFPLVRDSRRELGEKIKQALIGCLKSDCSNMVFAHSIRGKEYLICTLIQDTIDEDYKSFWSISFESRKLIEREDDLDR